MKTLLTSFLLLASLSWAQSTDSLILENGKIRKGNIVKIANGQLWLGREGFSPKSYPLDEIKEIYNHSYSRLPYGKNVVTDSLLHTLQVTNHQHSDSSSHIMHKHKRRHKKYHTSWQVVNFNSFSIPSKDLGNAQGSSHNHRLHDINSSFIHGRTNGLGLVINFGYQERVFRMEEYSINPMVSTHSIKMIKVGAGIVYHKPLNERLAFQLQNILSFTPVVQESGRMDYISNNEMVTQLDIIPSLTYKLCHRLTFNNSINYNYIKSSTYSPVVNYGMLSLKMGFSLLLN